MSLFLKYIFTLLLLIVLNSKAFGQLFPNPLNFCTATNASNSGTLPIGLMICIGLPHLQIV